MENQFSDTDLSQFYTRRNSGAGNISSVSLVAESQLDVMAEKNAGEIPHGDAVPAVSVAEMPETPVAEIPEIPVADERIAGFLYSVSKQEQGEFWTLRMGDNSIGNAAESDVALHEVTVSNRHATLLVESGEKGLSINLYDCQSAKGTYVNGQRVGSEGQGCYHGDIITVGEHYELLLLIADARKYHLKPVGGFCEGAFAAAQELTARGGAAEGGDDGTVAINTAELFDSESTRFL